MSKLVLLVNHKIIITIIIPFPNRYSMVGSGTFFHHRNWRAKVSCDVDINQSAGSMVIVKVLNLRRHPSRD